MTESKDKVEISVLRCISLLFFLFFYANACSKALPLDRIQLPAGFNISVYAYVPDARSLALGDDGIVFVGSRGAGKVYAVLPGKNFSHAKEVLVIASDLKQPNGVDYKDGSLYVAESERILRFPNIEKQLKNPTYQILYDHLPTARGHHWRYMRIGPDQWLYIGIGAPCNVCLEKDPFATLARIRLDGKDFQIFARGIRNTVGFDWDPITKELWFTDNGRDWLGNNIPPDELNKAPRAGMDFGFPYYWGDNKPDPTFGKMRKSQGMTIPEFELGPHVAALGMRFYTGTMFPEEYQHQIFIAEHGSWNRFQKIGYRISRVRVKNGKAISYDAFASGWLQGNSYWGRPVDLLILPDGSLLVSDDHAGILYRITYNKDIK